jgi:hypothetical protein
VETIVEIPNEHKYQREILKHRKRFNVVACGRRFGKTQLALIRSIDKMQEGLPIAYFAPTYKMLQEFWREAERMYKPIITHTSKQDHRFEIVGGGSFQMWSLDSADTVRGRKYALALIDEAAMVPNLEDAWNAVIRPTLTDYEGEADFYSTPKGLNYFYTLFGRGDDPHYVDWASFRYPTTSNPYIKDSEVELARLDLPEMVFKQEYLAEFIQGEGAVFRNITANLYDGTKEKDKDGRLFTNPEAHKGHVLVAGVDWGAVNDFTAISVACETCGRECELERFNKIDWEFQRAKLSALIERWNVVYTVCEENSIGSPNLEALQKLLPKRKIEGFMTTAQSKPPLIQSLALCFEQEEMKWIANPIATRELEAYEAKRNEVTNRIQYSAPEGFHDDTVIARALVREAIEQRKRNTWSIGRRTIR